MKVDNGETQTEEEYNQALIDKQIELVEFLHACMETRKLMSTIHPQDLKIIDQYILIEDFSIMYDQLLERLADQHGIDIFDKSNKSDDDLPF